MARSFVRSAVMMWRISGRWGWGRTGGEAATFQQPIRARALHSQLLSFNFLSDS